MNLKNGFFPFRYKINLILIALVISAIGVLSAVQYISISEVLKREYQQKVDLLQSKTIDSLRAMDLTYSVLEKNLEDRMRLVSGQIAADYQKTGNIELLELDKYKNSIKGMDISFINNKYVISKTTDRKSLYMDYKLWPEISDSFKLIKSNKVFVSDRITISVIAGEIRKYSYLVTHDGQYIIELSIDMNQFSDVFGNVDFNTIAKGLVEANKTLCNVTIFSSNGKAYGKKDMYGDTVWVADDNIRYFQQALDENITAESTGAYKGHKAYYRYIPIQAFGAEIANKKYILEFVYNDWELAADLMKYKLITLYVMLGGIVVTVLLGVMLSTRMVKPVNTLIKGTEALSKGNFNHQTVINTRDEFRILGDSFNSMTQNIRNLIDERNMHVQVLNEKNIEIGSQRDEINALYEETTAMNEELEELLDEVKQSYIITVQALANSIEANDEYTRGHCERVTNYSVALGKGLGMYEHDLLNLRFAAILHDVGKIGIPSGIINKDGKLTDEEFAIIRKHPEIGYNILKDIEFLDECREYIWQHHERVDGRGYPNALKGDEIKRSSRILSIADAFDAMTSSRPYRPQSLTVEQAVEQLRANKGTQFDAELVDIFIALIEQGKIKDTA